jgi:hypothetical protein
MIYWAALYLGRCVVLADRDAKIREADRQALVQSYGDEAMVYLHEAVRRGFKDLKQLKTHAILAPLRERADFQQLVQELENR